MNTILFFQPTIKGHYLEYIHHEYIGAISMKERYFFFLVPLEFKERKKMLNWPKASNVEFLFLTSSEEKKCNVSNRIKQSFNLSRITRHYIIKLSADIVFFNLLITTIPFLPFFIPPKCKICGIIYSIFTWDESPNSKIRTIANNVLYRLFAKHPVFHSVFLLNDEISVEKLNCRFKTNRFKYLPDPIQDIDISLIKDIRSSLGISKTDIVYLQLGIQPRKHVIDILNAIDIAPTDLLKNKVFIFTGVFAGNIEDKYRSYIKKLSKKAHIIDLSGRIPFDDLYNLFNISDFCFALYDNTNMSSGVIGYSAFFSTQVIGPSRGLLGHLIRANKLGICINNINVQDILSALTLSPIPDQQSYCNTHTVSIFNNCIFTTFNSSKQIR